MTADHHSFPPNDRRASNGLASPGHLHTLKVAGLIFSGVMVSLAGIFAVVEYSARHSRSMVESDIKSVNIRLDSQQAGITGLGDRTGRLEASTDYQFARIEQRFDKIDERFQRIDERFQRIDERFDRIDERFEKLEAKVDMKLERLEAKVDRKLDTVTELLLQLVEQKADRPVNDGPTSSKRTR